MAHTDSKPGEPKPAPPTASGRPEPQDSASERKLTPGLRLRQQEWRERIRRTATRLLSRRGK
jgi:hypothetical protein